MDRKYIIQVMPFVENNSVSLTDNENNPAAMQGGENLIKSYLEKNHLAPAPSFKLNGLSLRKERTRRRRTIGEIKI